MSYGNIDKSRHFGDFYISTKLLPLDWPFTRDMPILVLAYILVDIY